MKSRIFSFSEVKNTSKGQLWIPGFIAVACFVIFPVILLMSFGSMENAHRDFLDPVYVYGSYWKEIMFSLGTLVAAGCGILNGVNGFWYLYSGKKTDYYHSLPVKRGEMFWHKVYVGLLYFLIPYIIMEFAAICLGAAKGFFSREYLGIAGMNLLCHLLVYLMFYFSVVLVISMTGNLLMGVLSAGAVFLYGPVLSHMLFFGQDLFFENCGLWRYGLLEILWDYGSPVVLAHNLAVNYQTGEFGRPLGVLVIYIAVLLPASWAAYVKRPLETTGKSLVYKASEIVIRLMMVVPVALGVGVIFYGASYTGVTGNVFWWIFGLVLGGVLAHGIMGIILKMDFRGFFSDKGLFVVSAVLVGICAFIFQKDLFGYDAYLPAYEKLAGVSVEGARGNYYQEYLDIKKTDDGRYILNGYNDFQKVMDAQALEMTPEIYETLQSVVEASLHEDEEDLIKSGYTVKYILKSGEAVYRQYRMDREQVRKFMLYDCEQSLSRIPQNSFLEIENTYLKGISGTFADDREYALFQEDDQKRNALVEALKQDLQEAETADFLEVPVAFLNFRYEGIPLAETTGGEPVVGNKLESSYTGYLYVYPAFEKTVAILKETGYPLSMDEVELERIDLNISVYNEESGYYEEMTETIEDLQQIEELKACMIAHSLNSEFQETDDEIGAVGTEALVGKEIHAALLSEKLPDFVKEIKNKYKKLNRTDEEGENRLGPANAVG